MEDKVLPTSKLIKLVKNSAVKNIGRPMLNPHYIPGKKYFVSKKLIVSFDPVGSNPKLVACRWKTEVQSGVSYGGFQRIKDFDYNLACNLALSTAESLVSEDRVMKLKEGDLD